MKYRQRILALLTLAAALPLALQAQPARLVRDLGHGDQHSDFGMPSEVASTPGKVFFAMGGENEEMWVSDGTAQGTLMLRDVCPGPCSSEPHIFGSRNGVLFWAALSEAGYQLWRSDGTRPGTYRLTDAPLATHFENNGVIPFAGFGGSALYFATATSISDPDDTKLWKTDGTLAGTQVVRELAPGLKIDLLLADSGRVFLIVRDSPTTGSQHWSIWSTDGTAAGTREIAPLGTSRPILPKVAGGHLFFIASTDGDELWASDGTPAGTLPVTHFANPYPFGDIQSINFYDYTVSGSRALFVADDVLHGKELWVSDGTPAGTKRTTDFGNGDPGIEPLADLGGHIVFRADDGLGKSGLWVTEGDPASVQYLPLPCGQNCAPPAVLSSYKTGTRLVLFVQTNFGVAVVSVDGTPAGTRLLRDSCSECDAQIADNTPAETDVVYFLSRFGQELWRTDGTAAGTRRAAAFPEAGRFGEDRFVIAAGPRPLLFATYRGILALWSITPAGMQLVTAFAPDGGSADVEDLTPFQSRLAFTACVDDVFAIWQSAGTEASTAPIVSLQEPELSFCASGYVPGSAVSAGPYLFFVREDENRRRELWRTDGTAPGTIQLSPERVALPLVVHNGRVFFATAHEDERFALWSSDGTPAGTHEVYAWPDIAKAPIEMTSLGSDLYFMFGYTPQELWKSDGTTQGTRKVTEGGHTSTVPVDFTKVGSTVYFVWQGSGSSADEVWKTDGTAAGTVRVGRPAGMATFPSPTELTAFQGALYFFAATDREEERGFWRTDGTAAGTTLLGRFRFAGNSAYPPPQHLTAAAGRLFFTGDDGVHGVELWTSDGTAAGTRLVRDIRPGAVSSNPVQLTAAGGRLYFAAGEELYGIELWQSDGTTAGTRLVQDIAPLGQSSQPKHLTVAGDRLYFTADDGVTGRELWSLPLTGPAGCQPSSAHLCLNGGRYQVEIAWRTVTDGIVNEGRGTAVPLSGDTGYFWFFSPTNVETIVKVLDGQGVNGHVWVFYGALSDVQYTVTVTDTQTGVARRYFNPQGQLASVGDTQSFGRLGAYSANPPALIAPPSPKPIVSERADKAAVQPCQASAQRLCLNNNRFAVEVSWKDFQGHTGTGTAVPLTGDTGTFWFFNSANTELVVKVLDGRPVNGKFWLFYGALSNVEYTLTVTDTQTGQVKTYKNPSGRFGSVADTSAF